MKDRADPYINVGAILRITPIKDVKTLINAFYFAWKQNPALKLWVMGPDDEDEAYAQECYNLVDSLQAQNIVFTGRIKTLDYIGKMDMTILTSISEGQPLTILEGYAVKKPCIATNVGNCYGLIYGEEGDNLGSAGIVVPVMNIQEISEAILTLAGDQKLREQMGEIGYQRLMKKYRIEYMKQQYQNIYTSLAGKSSI
jgi:glycosyltransferase involved in cell wall biosynthesis